MMKIDGKVTILFSKDGMSIELHDDRALITFARIELNSEQACHALSRLSHCECESMEVFNLDKVGKKHEQREFSFELPEKCGYIWGEERIKIAIEECQKVIPDGWEADTSYSSQGSFFTKDEKCMARTIIRRYV